MSSFRFFAHSLSAEFACRPRQPARGRPTSKWNVAGSPATFPFPTPTTETKHPQRGPAHNTIAVSLFFLGFLPNLLRDSGDVGELQENAAKVAEILCGNRICSL